MPRGRSTTIEQERAIYQLVQEGYGAAQIYRELGAKGLLGENPFKLKTVERRVREFAGQDASGPWSMVEADAEEARLVLDVLGFGYAETQGRAWISKERAKWIVRVRTASPTIDVELASWVAREYQRLSSAGNDTRHLDLLLGTRPWEGSEQNRHWYECLGALVSGHPDPEKAGMDMMPIEFQIDDEDLDLRDFLVDRDDHVEEIDDLDDRGVEAVDLESIPFEE